MRRMLKNVQKCAKHDHICGQHLEYGQPKMPKVNRNINITIWFINQVREVITYSAPSEKSTAAEKAKITTKHTVCQFWIIEQSIFNCRVVNNLKTKNDQPPYTLKYLLY